MGGITKQFAPAVMTPTETILESISDGVFTVDKNWCVTSFNRAGEDITGVSRVDAVGRRCADVFRSSICGEECALQHTMRTGKPVIGKTCYIIDVDGNRIPISISTAVLRDANGRVIGGVETFRDVSEIEALRHELAGKCRVGELVSHSPLMQRLFEVLPAIAASSSTVLIQGATGTGKEMLAKTIHALSSCSSGPFIAVNCGALPDTLLESELFGYKAGAFTGATKDHRGRFALAQGGTLFLDEIGDISPALQTRLLRVLQERCYEPLGCARSEKTDARIIVASNKDLGELVRKQQFREDLYYRVNVVRVELPPLDRRKEDIALLVGQFIERFNRLQRKTILGISGEAQSLLMAHNWPGNVRELENVIERAFILCNEDYIKIAHLPDDITKRNMPGRAGVDVRSAHEELDADAIRAALERNHYNRLAAARELGMHKTTLFRKIRKLGLILPAQDGRARKQ